MPKPIEMTPLMRKVEIKRLEEELKELREADRECPDEDTSICYVVIRTSVSEVYAGEYFDRSTVRPTRMSCHYERMLQEADNQQFADEFPFVRLAKVRLVKIEE